MASQWLPERQLHRSPWSCAPFPCLEQKGCHCGSEGMKCLSMKQDLASQRGKRETDGDIEPMKSDTLGFKSPLGHLPTVRSWAGHLTSVGLSFHICNMKQSHSFHRIVAMTEGDVCKMHWHRVVTAAGLECK